MRIVTIARPVMGPPEDGWGEIMMFLDNDWPAVPGLWRSTIDPVSGLLHGGDHCVAEPLLVQSDHIRDAQSFAYTVLPDVIDNKRVAETTLLHGNDVDG